MAHLESMTLEQLLESRMIYGGDGHFSGHLDFSESDLIRTLKPCPFCGSTDLEIVNTHTSSYWVTCQECGVEADSYSVEYEFPFKSPQEVYDAHMESARGGAETWNTRTYVEFGEIHDNGLMMLRQLCGTCKHPETKNEFEMCYSMADGTPIITCTTTGKWYRLAWRDLVNMAIRAGIAKE